ncbi:MAG: DUF6560 family protein [Atopobiaceae bacterium]
MGIPRCHREGCCTLLLSTIAMQGASALGKSCGPTPSHRFDRSLCRRTGQGIAQLENRLPNPGREITGGRNREEEDWSRARQQESGRSGTCGKRREAQMAFIGSMIAVICISLMLTLLVRSTQDRKTSSIYRFNVRAGTDLAYIAFADIAFSLALLVGLYIQEGGVTAIQYAIGSIMPVLGLLLLILTLPGADEIHVDHDEIEVQRAWLFKKHWSFQNIDYVAIDHNGMHVFARGRQRQAFLVDSMYAGWSNFIKRVKRDKIEVRVKSMSGSEIIAAQKRWNRISWLLVIGIVVVCALVYLVLQ